MTILHRRNSRIFLIQLTTVEIRILDRDQSRATYDDMMQVKSENNNKIASKFVQNGRQQNKTAARFLAHEVSHG
jgi:hypothetical protein